MLSFRHHAASAVWAEGYAHVVQDRQNFGTDGVADPDREVAHEHVYRRQRRP